MDYEKAYKEALERCKWLLANQRIKEQDATDLFRELAESDDERIRKGIREVLLDAPATDIISKGLDLEQAFAWLEKQKEQKPIVYNEDTYTTAKEKSWAHYSSLTDNFSKGLFEKIYHEGYCFGIHEEKPHTWTAHDELVRKEAIACLQDWRKIIPPSYITDYDNILCWLQDELSVHTNQKPAEWSEEDEKHIAVIAAQLEAYQPDRTLRNPLQKHIDWLKSLRPNHWKPSAEQMMHLAAAVEESNENPVLDSLYNELKKL